MLVRRFFGLLLSAVLVIGCASRCAELPASLGGSDNLAVDPADPCGTQRQHFADSQTFFTKEIVVRAVAGAVVGAGAGAAVGGATNGAKGAGIGAAIGAVGGGLLGLTSGYWDKLQQQNLDKQQLSQTVNADLRTESSHMDATAGAFAALRTCRFAQAKQIKTNGRRGALTRDQTQAQLAQERSWFDEEIRVAKDAGVNMQKRDEQFTYAATNLNQGPAKTAATETIPQKRNSFDNTVTTAQAQSTSTFSLEDTG
jgi:uncharacterized protein YcfJ